MKAKELTVLAGISLLALCAPPLAEGASLTGNGQIRGEVSDPSGTSLVGISIVLSPTDRPDVVYVTSTDDKGRFAFNGLVPGMYEVQANGQGVRPLVKEGIQVKPPFRAITALKMEPIQDGSEAALASATAAVTIGPEASGPVLNPDLARATQPLEEGGAGTNAGLNRPLAASAVPGGEIKKVHGRFVDADGQAVVEGSITLRRLGVETDVFYARTDRNGGFELADVPAGTYDITTRSPGLIPLHLRQQSMPAQDAMYLSLVAPAYPLAFRGFLDDLLPEEVPVPPPSPRAVDLVAGDPMPVGVPDDEPADGDAVAPADDPAAPSPAGTEAAPPEEPAPAKPADPGPANPPPAKPADPAPTGPTSPA